jgi:hypothetical protein
MPKWIVGDDIDKTLMEKVSSAVRRYPPMRLVTGVVVLTLLMTFGCGRKDEVKRILESPISYQSYVSPWAEFERYKTWDWVSAMVDGADETRAANPELRRAMQEGVARQMSIRGYKRTSVAPDIVVNYHYATTTIDKDYVKKMYNGTYYPEYRMDFEGPRSARNRWEEGFLVVFIFETASRRMIWRGSAQAEVTNEAPVEESEKRLKKVLKWMFTSLPGRPSWEMD